MKKLGFVLVAVVVGVGCLGSLAQAGTVGNILRPRFPLPYGWQLSPEWEMLGSKELKTDLPGISGIEVEGNWGFLRATREMGERADIYGKLGVSDLEASWMEVGTPMAIEMDRALALAIGGSGELWRVEAFALRLGGEIRWTEPDVDKVKRAGIPATSVSGSLEMWEWQVSLAVSREFEQFIPYIGVRYSDSEIDPKDAGFTIGGTPRAIVADMESDNNIGIFAGFSYLLRDDFAFSLEGRMGDEEAMTFSLHWLF